MKFRSRRRVLIGGATFVALSALVVAVSVVSAQPKPGGPVIAPGAHGSALPIKVGEKFTDTFDVIRVSGKRSIVVDSIVPDYDSDAVHTLGVRLSDPRRAEMISAQLYYRWPATSKKLGTVITAAGATIQPQHAGYRPPQVLMGMVVTREGHFLRRGFWVNYHQGQQNYRQFFDAQMTFCTPKFMKGDECPFLGG